MWKCKPTRCSWLDVPEVVNGRSIHQWQQCLYQLDVIPPSSSSSVSLALSRGEGKGFLGMECYLYRKLLRILCLPRGPFSQVFHVGQRANNLHFQIFQLRRHPHSSITLPTFCNLSHTCHPVIGDQLAKGPSSATAVGTSKPHSLDTRSLNGLHLLLIVSQLLFLFLHHSLQVDASLPCHLRRSSSLPLITFSSFTCLPFRSRRRARLGSISCLLIGRRRGSCRRPSWIPHRLQVEIDHRRPV